MKKIVIIGLLSIVSLASTCRRNCPDDIMIGELSLTEQSKDYFPYQGDQKLIFKANTGEQIEFKSRNGGVQTETDRISVYKMCTEFRYDGPSSYKYFEGELIHATYFCQEPPLSYGIRLSTQILRPEHELFFDKLLIDVMATGSIGRGEIATDIRFTEPYQEEELNFNSPMVFVDEVTLNGVTYTEVYKSEPFEEAQIFYTKAQGLVGFTTNDSKTYNLDRIE